MDCVVAVIVGMAGPWLFIAYLPCFFGMMVKVACCSLGAGISVEQAGFRALFVVGGSQTLWVRILMQAVVCWRRIMLADIDQGNEYGGTVFSFSAYRLLLMLQCLASNNFLFLARVASL